jgi:hypothetical protein
VVELSQAGKMKATATVLKIELFSVWSMLRLYNEIPKITKAVKFPLWRRGRIPREL